MEPLKHELSGYWSRRIDTANRLVYKVEDNNSILFSAVHITINQKPNTRSNLTTGTVPRYVDACLAPKENLTEKGIRLWEKERKNI